MKLIAIHPAMEKLFGFKCEMSHVIVGLNKLRDEGCIEIVGKDEPFVRLNPSLRPHIAEMQSKKEAQ